MRSPCRWDRRAAQKGEDGIVALLTKREADLDVVDGDLQTPLVRNRLSDHTHARSRPAHHSLSAVSTGPLTRDTRPSRGTSSNTGLPWTFKTSSDILVFARPSSHQRSFLSLFFSLMFLVCFVCADHARTRRTKQRCIGRRRWASGTWWASCCDPTPTPTYRTKTVRMRVASGDWLNESHYF